MENIYKPMDKDKTLRQEFYEKFWLLWKWNIKAEDTLFDFIQSKIEEAEERGRQEMKKECLDALPD